MAYTWFQKLKFYFKNRPDKMKYNYYLTGLRLIISQFSKDLSTRTDLNLPIQLKLFA